MRHLRTIVFALLALASVAARGQRRLVVADVETLLPIAGASVVGSGPAAVSDSAGVVVVADSCRSLAVSHINYESRLVNADELRLDTVFLVSRLLALQGVVVFGKATGEDGLEELRRRLRMQRTEAQLAAANPNSGINLLGIISAVIPKKWKKSKARSRKEKLEHILNDY